MARYSYRAASALAYLKRPYNDVDIYVEDTGNHNMWLLLVRRLLTAGKTVCSVNMLGGRDAVLQACEADQADSGRSKLYIIDGDFDFLKGAKKRRLKHLYRLRAYCVENLLVNEVSLIHIAQEYKPRAKESELSHLINFDVEMQSISQRLRPLFVSYATCHSLAPEFSTIGFAVTGLITQMPDGPTLDRAKIFKRILSISRNVVAKVGLTSFRTKRALISARADSLHISQIISGKDYLLPMILMRFRIVCGYKPGIDQFKVALARSYDASAEPWLAKRISAL